MGVDWEREEEVIERKTSIIYISYMYINSLSVFIGINMNDTNNVLVIVNIAWCLIS